MLALSEGLRQEVKSYNLRTTVISPGAVATELPNTITDPEIAERINKFYGDVAIPADSFARAVAFAISQPEDMDVNEILFRPTQHKTNCVAKWPRRNFLPCLGNGELLQ